MKSCWTETAVVGEVALGPVLTHRPAVTELELKGALATPPSFKTGGSVCGVVGGCGQGQLDNNIIILILIKTFLEH